MPMLAILLIGLLAIPLLALCIARPMQTVLPLYAGSLPLTSAINVPIPLPEPFNTLSSMLGALAIGAGLAHIVLYKSGRIPSLPIAMWLLFLSAAMLTALWAIDSSEATGTMLVAIPLILLMVVVAMLPADERDLDVMKVAIIAGAAVVGGWALFLLLTGRALPSHGVSERFSVATDPDSTNPNILAATLLLPLALSLEKMIFGGTRWWRPATWRVVGVVGSFLTVAGLVLTSSRGGILSAIAVFVVCFFYAARLPEARRLVLKTLAGVLAFLALFAALTFVSTTLSPRGPVSRILSSGPFERIASRQTDSSGRLEIWTAGRLACERYCDVGAGLGNFENAYSEVFAFSAAAENVGAARPAHNVYLGMVVETGFLGLLLLLLAIVSEWLAVSKPELRDLSPGLKASLVGLLLASMFLSAIWFKYFWLVFVLIRVSENARSPQAASLPQGLIPSVAR